MAFFTEGIAVLKTLVTAIGKIIWHFLQKE